MTQSTPFSFAAHRSALQQELTRAQQSNERRLQVLDSYEFNQWPEEELPPFKLNDSGYCADACIRLEYREGAAEHVSTLLKLLKPLPMVHLAMSNHSATKPEAYVREVELLTADILPLVPVHYKHTLTGGGVVQWWSKLSTGIVLEVNVEVRTNPLLGSQFADIVGLAGQTLLSMAPNGGRHEVYCRPFATVEVRDEDMPLEVWRAKWTAFAKEQKYHTWQLQLIKALRSASLQNVKDMMLKGLPQNLDDHHWLLLVTDGRMLEGEMAATLWTFVQDMVAELPQVQEAQKHFEGELFGVFKKLMAKGYPTSSSIAKQYLKQYFLEQTKIAFSEVSIRKNGLSGVIYCTLQTPSSTRRDSRTFSFELPADTEGVRNVQIAAQDIPVTFA